MQLEIERKLPVADDTWRAAATGCRTLRDGLVSQGERGKVRVRLDGARARLAVKGARQGITRAEFEYKIPLGDAERLLADVCVGDVIEKDRHLVPFGSCVWEVDVFKGPFKGVMWAEVELENEDEAFDSPPWLGPEVTGDLRFRQGNLLRLCDGLQGKAAFDRLLAQVLYG
ncbi:CYTH domain-containing protein [Aureimonas sp. ME7]|uniref:CYTH domain-containing protein n=1 Tax=Aureimonas sp. ME7 TaxID=2744252 RepID=UPI0015F725D8|nr:CYTH domain-containing protein [Aureimonas sp. ME7]